MREIKFRVYDKQFKKWIRLDYYKDLGAITIETDGTLTLGSAFRFTDSMMIIPEEFELMQYTGLKDKNGKEIYEGDIIKATDEYATEKDKCIILWDNESLAFIFKYIGCSDSYCGLDSFYNDDMDDYEIEIIGNIYDNPELLEGE